MFPIHEVTTRGLKVFHVQGRRRDLLGDVLSSCLEFIAPPTLGIGGPSVSSFEVSRPIDSLRDHITKCEPQPLNEAYSQLQAVAHSMCSLFF